MQVCKLSGESTDWKQIFRFLAFRDVECELELLSLMITGAIFPGKRVTLPRQISKQLESKAVANSDPYIGKTLETIVIQLEGNDRTPHGGENVIT